ncbi:microtubule-associated protein Jupiter isoform X7 [Aedes albopictus]|uniref:Microtubule-associated protein Jupiter n=1 Tax=Aedes albopictus TaxID=7160 RepID=A0ABM1ZL38_AEDAL|nr:microtubule-associated protein Jupiter isoform X8 [Aedes albopictus]
MATYAAFKHVELFNVGNAKKRVLKPPGGGSSDLFGADNQPQTPRSMNKNRMQSNIFAAPEGQKAGNENGNPVTGEGYKSGGAAEINTTVPSLNGAGHVINKNRIPPGGFSSGLW